MSELNTAETRPSGRYFYKFMIALGLVVAALTVVSGWFLLPTVPRWNGFYRHETCVTTYGLLAYLIPFWFSTAGILFFFRLVESLRENALPAGLRRATSAAIFIAMTVAGTGYYVTEKIDNDWRFFTEKTCEEMSRIGCTLTF